MILDMLEDILILGLIVFLIACTFALVCIEICMYEDDIKDIIDNLKKNKGE